MQGIRDMLTQRQSQYVWEAYLKHRKHGKTVEVLVPAALRRDPLKASSGGTLGVGHNKCCTDKGN